MPQVRIKHNYKYIIVDHNGRDDRSQSCVVQALLKNGDTRSLTFGGFIESDRCDFMQRVKLVGVSSFTQEDHALTGWIEYPSSHYVIGVMMWDCYYMVLFDGLPRSIAMDLPPPRKKENNVFYIEKAPTHRTGQA